MAGKKSSFFIFSLLLSAFLPIVLLTAQPCFAAGPAECLECHDDIDAAKFEASPHAVVQCTGCHHEIVDVAKHEEGNIDIGPVQCSKCHKEQAEKLAASPHAAVKGGCNSCHPDIHALAKEKNKQAMVEVCAGCHDVAGADFAKSVHGMGLAKGNKDLPDCAACHGTHDIKALGKEPASRERRLLTVESCKPCHAKEQFATSHGLSSEYVTCYEESYHGKVFSLGYCTRVAGCSDCHTPHKILAAADPASSVNKANLAATCGVERCHPGANMNFALYYAHGNHRDKAKYPIMYWTFIIMSCLLIGVFAFFWLHTLLWWQRAFRENREKRKEHAHPAPPELALQGEVYTRFNWFGITMHFLMLVSFVGLVFTGLPLKFAHVPWAGYIMKIWGGAAGAGLVHRICALITFFYFGAVNAAVIYWLFFKKTGQNLIQKFFGPDSLFPNLKDVSDIGGMFKWFFNAGPKPQFGRWTYWEKFDFLAVYWGMFAIGFTGLVLWFPVWFAKFLPGWLFNVSTIMHSDEAMLAAGFIFTVHFFNTHLRPEKFPMDMVIFTGKVTRHEMIEERPEQIKLEKKKGTMEKMQTGYAGSLFEFASMIIGYGTIVLGLISVYLMFNGLFGH